MCPLSKQGTPNGLAFLIAFIIFFVNTFCDFPLFVIQYFAMKMLCPSWLEEAKQNEENHVDPNNVPVQLAMYDVNTQTFTGNQQQHQPEQQHQPVQQHQHQDPVLDPVKGQVTQV